MIAKLFVPHIIKDQVFHFQIGYQHIIIIENKRYINQITKGVSLKLTPFYYQKNSTLKGAVFYFISYCLK